MQAIILAAGQGTRLKKYTENLPKGMLLFAGKTILERQIEQYRRCGIERIMIVTGFAAHTIQYPDIIYFHNEDFATTNMIESFMKARELLTEDTIVSYSDILFSEEMLRGMMDAQGDYVVAVDKEWKKYWQKRYGKIDFDTESLKLDENDKIVSLGLENPPLEEIDARYVGLLKFSAKGLAKIMEIWDRDYDAYLDKPWQQSGKKIRQAYMTDLLQALIENGETISAAAFRNGWMEFDTNEDYENACRWLEDGTIKEVLDIQA